MLQWLKVYVYVLYNIKYIHFKTVWWKPLPNLVRYTVFWWGSPPSAVMIHFCDVHYNWYHEYSLSSPVAMQWPEQARSTWGLVCAKEQCGRQGDICCMGTASIRCRYKWHLAHNSVIFINNVYIILVDYNKKCYIIHILLHASACLKQKEEMYYLLWLIIDNELLHTCSCLTHT